jgi:hypothetical protein
MPNQPRIVWLHTTRFAVITVAVVEDVVGAIYEVALSSWGGLVRVAVRVRTVDAAVRLASRARNAGRFPAAAGLLALGSR